MTSPAPRIRVAAYAVRQRSDGSELLVFDHVGMPEAGTQVPAGGVEPGERPPDAVIREVYEETGLTSVEVVAELGIYEDTHPHTGQPRHTTYFHLRTPAETPDQWRYRVNGSGEEEGLLFDCWFQPLPLPALLADHQDIFLPGVQSQARRGQRAAHG